MGCSARCAAALGFLVLALCLEAQVQPAPRRPRGIYAVVNVESGINQQQKANPSITPAELNAYFVSLFQDLLGNPAISGLTLQVHWDTLNPNAPPAANAYDWSYVDDAFNQASAWNAQNPALAPKGIQLIVTPGFQTPQWVLDQIPSCDGLFQSPVQTPSTTCGTATFVGFSEAGDGTALPLPWNPLYKTSWQTFLTALAARYGANPVFVSIAVAGPTAASAEMILPNNVNSNNPQTQFGTGIAPNAMWEQLLAFHYPGLSAYQKSDQAFIDEWNAAIDMYAATFSGVTLVATTGDGLPNLSANNFTIPTAFTGDCGTPNMDCAAETTILSHFVESTVGGANAKATQTSGMEASRAGVGDLGVAGVKRLSQSTASLATPSTQILGGAQFNTSFANFTLQEGCLSTFPPDASDTPAGCTVPPTCTTQGCLPVACIPQACLAPGVTQADLAGYAKFSAVPSKFLIPPEQAEYNVLNVYFDGTAAATSFGGATGTAPLNYLQIYSPDIQYAETNVEAPAQVVQTGGATVAMSAEELLNLARAKLFGIGEPALVLSPAPSIASGGVVPAFSSTGVIEPGEWVSIYGTNLAGGTATWTGNFPTFLAGTSVTINGQAAYLAFVSPGQINLQVPNDTATGAVPVVVTTASGSATSTVTLAAFGPSFFLLDSKHVAGIILRSNGSGAYGGGSYDILGPTGTSLGYRTVAAKAGDVVELFGTGFGPTKPAVLAGQAFSGAAPTTNPVTLHINNVSMAPAFAGLSSAGLYQFNLIVPSGVSTGDVSLQAAVAGVATPSGVVISLQ
jgi:uncharacterized protein (TIGR03437 family)